MTPLDHDTIAIIGLGLMGGSLAAALKAQGTTSRIRGIARRAENVQQAMARGLIDEGTCDAGAGVSDADLVVLATPVRTTIALLEQLGPRFPQGCIVTDMGSTKTGIMRAMDQLPSHVEPIGGHPMCGREVAGLDAAEAGLFQGKIYVLSPLGRTSHETITVMEQLVELIQGRSIIIDPERHDRIVAAISHLPYLLAACLVSTAESVAAEEDMVWTLAASGFRDTSRLAASETRMMCDILLTNRTNIRDMIRHFQQQLGQLDAYLTQEDEDKLCTFMSKIRERRKGLFR